MPAFKLGGELVLPPHSDGMLKTSTTLAKTDVRLWDFDHPHPYTMTTRLTAGDKLLHEKSDRFGIRKVEITPDGMLLNGEPVRLAGFNRVSDSYETGNTEPDELVHKDIDLMKSAGANFARLMHTPQAPNLLDYLDEKGMMTIAEIPVWGSNDPQIKKDNPLTEQWLKEMIKSPLRDWPLDLDLQRLSQRHFRTKGKAGPHLGRGRSRTPPQGGLI